MIRPSRVDTEGNNVRCNHWLHLLDELSIGAFTVDDRRRVSSMNFSAQSLMGMRETEVIGKDCREVFTGVPCLASCPFKAPEVPVTDEPNVVILDEMDEKHLVTRMAAPVYDRERNVVGCMTVLQDQKPIADLIDRIHYEERSMKIILDNLNIGIFTVNLESYITFFNKEAEKKGVFLGVENRYYFNEIPDFEEIAIIMNEFEGVFRFFICAGLFINFRYIFLYKKYRL